MCRLVSHRRTALPSSSSSFRLRTVQHLRGLSSQVAPSTVYMACTSQLRTWQFRSSTIITATGHIMSLFFIITFWAVKHLTVLAQEEQYYIPHSPYNVVCQHQYEWFYMPDAVQYYPPPPKAFGDEVKFRAQGPIPQRAVTDFGQKLPHKPKAPIKPGEAVKARSELEYAESSDLAKPSVQEEMESAGEGGAESTTVEPIVEKAAEDNVECTKDDAEDENKV